MSGTVSLIELDIWQFRYVWRVFPWQHQIDHDVATLQILSGITYLLTAIAPDLVAILDDNSGFDSETTNSGGLILMRAGSY